MKALIFTLSPRQAVSEAFDGHPDIDAAIDYWAELPPDSVAYTPRGYEIDYGTILALAPWARLLQAAQAVLDDNAADLDCDTRSGSWLIGQDKLRVLRETLKT